MKLNIQGSDRIIIGLPEKDADRIMNVEGIDYKLEPLSNEGGNSVVFKLINTQNDNEELAIKFLKFPYTKNEKGMNSRFDREIEALKLAKEKGFQNLIDIISDGHERIEGKIYRYYVMEKADENLGNFIASADNTLSISQKIELSCQIIQGLKELHQLGVYHRDIKPGNILLIRTGEGKNIWKICDLGLIAYRDQDTTWEKGKIGPNNWLSPEAMNKYLCGRTIYESSFDVSIDEKSDIFQLGNVLWFIFNHNAPIGQVSIDDFSIKDYAIYSLIFTMLRHKKSTRGDLDFYQKYFSRIDNLYLSTNISTPQWLTRKCKKILRLE